VWPSRYCRRRTCIPQTSEESPAQSYLYLYPFPYPAVFKGRVEVEVRVRVRFTEKKRVLRVESSTSGGVKVSLIDAWTGQASRAISTARLRRLPVLHLPPINVLVSNGPSGDLRPGSTRLGRCFPLRCFQRFSRPDIATRRCHGHDSRYTRGQSDPVLSY
jgi:hypothetical protein